MSKSLRASRGHGMLFRRSRSRFAEPLDRRTLLAASASLVTDLAFPGAEILSVTGTGTAEVIRVAYNPSTNDVDVIVDGTTIFSTPTTRVYRIDINGQGGDDEIRVETKRRASVNGGSGNDTVIAASGRDSLYGDAGDDVLQGGRGFDSIDGGVGNDTIDGGGNDDFDDQPLFGGDGDDSMLGGAGRDFLDGGAGDDTLRGVGGNDRLLPRDGIDVVDGGSGNDRVDYSQLANGDYRTAGLRLSLDGVANDGEFGNATGDLRGVEEIIGGDGADSIAGSSRGDVIDGRGGNDTLLGLAGDDDLRGGEGNDLVEGGTGDDSLVADTGTDSLFGCAGDDRLTSSVTAAGLLAGGVGSDVVHVSAGASTVTGGAGDDAVYVTFYSGQSATALDLSGNGGADTLAFATNGYPETSPYVDLTLDGAANDHLFDGSASNVRPDFEVLYGTIGPDRFDGSMVAYRLTMEGGWGEDTLIGGSGSDKLRGGYGNDSIVGNAGTDFINAGWDQDFVDSADGVYDLVNGSSGLADRADRDAGLDDVSNVETFVA